VRADYERALKQRNALLRSASMVRRGARGGQAPDLATLDVWDAHLARAGAQLLAARLGVLRGLAPLVDKAYGTIAGHSGASVEYRASCALGPEDAPADRPLTIEELEAALAAALAEARPGEVERGLTLVGPHRDDLALTLDYGSGPLPAKGYASHGESWSFALAVKLASYELLRADGIEPVLLLDDVFAELDATRRAQLATVAEGAEQVIVTAAVEQDVPPQLGGKRYLVTKGAVAVEPHEEDAAAAESADEREGGDGDVPEPPA